VSVPLDESETMGPRQARQLELGSGDPHGWSLSPKEAVELQRRLAQRVRMEPLPRRIRLVAGADVASSRRGDRLIAGVVVWDLQESRIVEQAVAVAKANFPYVPGLLSFREAPVLLAAFDQLCHQPDVAIFDGQGYAHPRRFGLACHVGVLIDVPSVGCAKSRLCGKHEEPGRERGSRAKLWDGEELLGTVLRTRSGVKPVYVSVGHRADLPSAERLVLRCASRYRLPEPTRLAHQLVSRERIRAG